MRILQWLGCALIVGSVAAATGSAADDDRWIVAGLLENVDEQTRLVEVEGHVLHIGPRAKIKLAGGVSGTWEDVVEREGEYVSGLVSAGYRGTDEVLTIVLDDPIEDEEE